MGGPPQHSTWDPKPDAPPEVRGEFGPIDTNVPGIRVASLLPRMAKPMDKLCVLRAVSTGDNAHSSSGYYMLTGVPHAPMNVENANPGAAQRLAQPRGHRPAAAAAIGAGCRRRCGCRCTSSTPTARSGRARTPASSAGPSDPWLFRCEPASANFRIPEFTLAADVAVERLGERRDLLQQLDRSSPPRAPRVRGAFGPRQAQAFDLLGSPRAARRSTSRGADRRPRPLRPAPLRPVVPAGPAAGRGGRRRWSRSTGSAARTSRTTPRAGTRTSTRRKRLKTALAPTADQAFAALLDDLAARGLLDETLVVCMAEFGRTPKFNPRAGRDHWGHVFSVALAGGGVQGGQVYGASDRAGRLPQGRPRPAAGPARDDLSPPGHPAGRRNPRQPRPPAAGDPRGSGAGDPVGWILLGFPAAYSPLGDSMRIGT